jgi:hypothetical protein
VQDRRNVSAAKRIFRRRLAGLKDKPRRLITDGLKSYGVAQRYILPEGQHRSSRYLNNRAENSHRPAAPPRATDAAVQFGRQAQRSCQPAAWSMAISVLAAPDDGRRVTPRPDQGPPVLAAGDLRPSDLLILRALTHAAKITLSSNNLPIPLPHSDLTAAHLMAHDLANAAEQSRPLTAPPYHPRRPAGSPAGRFFCGLLLKAIAGHGRSGLRQPAALQAVAHRTKGACR